MADKNMEAQISVEFEEATSRQSLNSGETINTLWGKAKRWLTDLKAVAFSGSYIDLSDRPTIPAAITESTVSGWGFTKNTGTYSKPSGGIPKTDLTSGVQTSLSKADTALQEHQSLADYVKTTDSRLSDARTPKAHNQASNTINAMTGYSKPSSTSAIATSDTLNTAIGKLEKALDGKQASGSYAAASHTHTKSQIIDFPTSLPANGGTADTAKNLSSFNIPYNRPIENGGNGKQWIKFAEVVDNEIATANRWYGKALEFEIFNNGYGSIGNFVSMGRVSLCVSVHNHKTFTKEDITIKWQNCKPNAYTINHIVAVVTDTKVEFFVLNDVWDTTLTFVITRDIGIAYGSTYTSTQYTSDGFATYYSDKKIIQGSLDNNLYVYNSTKVNNHTVETDVPANAKFTDTVYTLPAATSSALGGVKIGSNITNSSGTISLTKENVTAALGYTPPTTNTTYGVATSSALGLVKSGTDITVDSSGNVSVNDDSHNHVVSNIDGLQTTLDGKLNKSGGTMTGALVAQSNTAYTTAQVRNVTMSTSAPTGGSNGQIHYQYS